MSVINYTESIVGALEGQPARLGNEVRVTKIAGEDIKPGRFVCRKDTDLNCKLPTTVAEVLACIGFTELGDTFPLDSDGEYASGKYIPVFQSIEGVWAVTIDAATQGGQVFVNYAGANPKGSVSAAFVSGENCALPGCVFETSQATPGGKVQIKLNRPAGSGNAAGVAGQRTLGIVVTYDGSGVPTIGATAGVSVVDTGTGVFQLVVAGAASVLPLGSPIKLKATPDSSDAPVSVFEVEAIAATSVTYSHRVVQADATPAGDAADPANGDKIYVGLLVTYA